MGRKELLLDYFRRSGVEFFFKLSGKRKIFFKINWEQFVIYEINGKLMYNEITSTFSIYMQHSYQPACLLIMLVISYQSLSLQMAVEIDNTSSDVMLQKLKSHDMLDDIETFWHGNQKYLDLILDNHDVNNYSNDVINRNDEGKLPEVESFSRNYLQQTTDDVNRLPMETILSSNTSQKYTSFYTSQTEVTLTLNGGEIYNNNTRDTFQSLTSSNDVNYHSSQFCYVSATPQFPNMPQLPQYHPYEHDEQIWMQQTTEVNKMTYILTVLLLLSPIKLASKGKRLNR